MSEESSGTNRPARRVVHWGDAIDWLSGSDLLEGCSLVTSLPDVSSFGDMSLDEWKAWFTQAARLCLEKTPDQGVTIFYQTDIKRDGTWVDKSYLCHKAAELSGSELLWHKIVCRKAPGDAAFGRPGYTHMLCYSRGVRDQIKQSFTDVFPTQGHMTWSQAMGVDSCEFACKYIASQTNSRTIVDPFCGVGTMLAVANQRGFDSIGVELGKRRAQKARNLQFESLKQKRTESPQHQTAVTERA